MRRANVIIAVRDTDLRLSLDLMLRDENNIIVMGTASTPQSTFGLTRIERPDLILLEWAMTDHPIEEMLKEIKYYSPNSKVILLGNSSNVELLTSRCDADAYLELGGAPEGLRSTIQNLITQDSETTQVKE
jgi:NarL family two-component system response regulator YdfI